MTAASENTTIEWKIVPSPHAPDPSAPGVTIIIYGIWSGPRCPQ